MLQTAAVAGATFGLLRELQRRRELAAFHLAGDTALALYMGHRKSVDLDLFTPLPFEVSELERYLVAEFGFEGSFRRQNTLKGRINEVAIDCITYPYPLLRPLVEAEGFACIARLTLRR